MDAVDTKAQRLKLVLGQLRTDGYAQAMVFTQFTDTMDFLRGYLVAGEMGSIMCFSGRGGEVLGTHGRWRHITRDEVKRLPVTSSSIATTGSSLVATTWLHTSTLACYYNS